MKKILFVAILALGVITLKAQEIKFFKGTFQEALIKAEKENKLIFVDAYTTWCGPCKYMSKNIFTDNVVGQYYNDNFINVKLDQEKGEGIDFAKKYEVRFFPSLFFINKDGEVAHKAIGSMDAQEFLKLGAESKENTTQLLWLQNEYESGNLKPELLKNLANAMKVAYLDGSEKVALEYLERQDNWKSEEAVRFIYEHFPTDVESELFSFVTNERELFDEIIGDALSIEYKISQAIAETLNARELEVEDPEIDDMFMQFYPENWEQKAEIYKISVISRDPADEDKMMLIERMIAYFNEYESDSWEELNAFAWMIYEKSDDNAQLKEAQKLALQSIMLEENFYNTDTYVWISDKLGDKKAVQKYAPIAIKLGKADDAETSDLENLLE